MSNKVIHIISRLSNQGPVNVLYNLLTASSYESRRNIMVVTLSSEIEETRLNEFLDLGIKVECLKIDGFKCLINFHKRIKPILESFEPKIIHSHCFRSIVSSGLFLSKKYKCVATVQNNPYHDFVALFGVIKGKLMANLLMFSLKNFSSIICCSIFVKDSINNNSIRNKLKVINNGVPLVSKCDTKNIAKNKLGIDSEKKVFIFIGSLCVRKDPITLINAFNVIAENHKDVILIVLGDGEFSKICKDKVVDNSKIMFFGNVPNIQPYLSASDFYVSSSLSEGMPTVVMNAMSCGIPSILSNISPHVEMFTTLNDYSFFFEPKDCNGLCKCIELILLQDYNQLSENVNRIYENRFSSNIMENNYAKEYDTF